MVPDDQATKVRQDEFRQRLELIVSNPQLAAEAFPNPDQRANILPLFDRLREIASELESGEGATDEEKPR